MRVNGLTPVPIFLNTHAGMSSPEKHALAQQLGTERVQITVVDPAALVEVAAAAAATGIAFIGVAGGDGSMRSAAKALAGTRTALLTVPTGTLNNFARRCGIDNVDAAAAALKQPHVMTLPVGDFDGDVFLNTLTIGEYARSVRLRERWRRWIGKWPAALVGITSAALSGRQIDLTVTTAGEVLERRTSFLWIGIGWGSFPRVHESLDRRSSPDLEVAVLRSSSRRATVAFVLRAGWHMLRGEQPVRDEALEVLHTRTLTLRARGRIDATADGEVISLKSPLHVSVRDDALRVVVAPDRVESAPA